MKLNKKRKGFTLVELIVVIVILGILMLIGSMKYADVKDQANISVMKTNHRTLVSALQLQMAQKQGALPGALATETGGEYSIAPSIKTGVPVGAAYSYDAATGVLTSTYTKVGDTSPACTIITNLSTGTTTETPAP